MKRLRIALLGVGLIGGSLALALRRAGVVEAIAGFDREADALRRALSLGAIDTAAPSIADAVRGAQLVIVAVPVRAMESVLVEAARALEPGAVMTDVGSTKSDVIRSARQALGDRFARFVPGHPIAGRETSGVQSATADLFDGARVVLTPGAETAPDAVQRVRECWEVAGSRVAVLGAERHDRVFAAVSHLPHLLSFALVAELAARPDADELLGFAGGGFRDFTRIAASSPEMWRDIALQNREPLLAELDRFAARLAALRELLEARDAAGLERLMAEARDARHAWAAQSRRGSPVE